MSESDSKSSVPSGVSKVHPLHRPMMPDDPLEMQAFELPGDARIMCRIVIEELARMGYDAPAITEFARNPFYTALHGIWRLIGEQEFSRYLSGVLSSVGVMRVRTVMAPPIGELVQIQGGSISEGLNDGRL